VPRRRVSFRKRRRGIESLILAQANYFGLNLFLELVSDIDKALLKPGIDRRARDFLDNPAIINIRSTSRFPLKMITRVHLEVSFRAFLELPRYEVPVRSPSSMGLRVTKVCILANCFMLDTADPLNIFP